MSMERPPGVLLRFSSSPPGCRVVRRGVLGASAIASYGEGQESLKHLFFSQFKFAMI